MGQWMNSASLTRQARERKGGPYAAKTDGIALPHASGARPAGGLLPGDDRLDVGITRR